MSDDTVEPVAVDVDRPLLDPHDDALGRQPLARSLAQLISTRQSGEGFVIALCGAWGSGKSTLLNFVRAYLEDPGTTPEDHRPIVIRFNPWWFHGPENLLHHFLTAFQTGLAGDKRYANAMRTLGVYAAALFPIAGLLPGVGSYADRVSTALSILRKHAQSPDEVRRRIDNSLEDSPRQILVVVDDIDRLTHSDIREMFKLVKSVADFPKTIYLLAFDKGPVIAALDQISGKRGEEYLHKIVQLEIDVPQPDPVVIRHLATSGLKRVLGKTLPDDLEDVYQEAIRHILRTVRDVKRYLNALAVTYPFVREEVNPEDFILVELLRIFAPTVYDAVRSNRERFAGGDSEVEAALGGGTPQERKPFYDEVVGRLSDHLSAPVLEMLKRLFPNVRASYGGPRSASTLNEDWRRERRVCSLEVFPVYFQLSVPVGEVSEETFRALCRAAADREQFSQALLELAKPSQPGEAPRSRLMSFLQRLWDHPDAIKTSSAPDRLGASIGALFDVGDRIYGEDWETLTDSSVDDMIVGTVSRLLDEGAGLTDYVRALSEIGHFDHLRDALNSTPSLYIPVLQISALIRVASKGAAPTVSPTHLDELRRLICEKIDRAAEDLSLAKVPRLVFVMSRWEEWCPDASVRRKRFVAQLLGTEEGPARLLAAHLAVSQVTPGLGESSRVEYRIDLRELSKDVGDGNAMNGLFQRVMEMSQESQSRLAPRGRRAIEVFGETWRRAGSQIPDVDRLDAHG